MDKPTATGKVSPKPKKRIIPRHVSAFHGGTFVVKKERLKRWEQDVLIHFGAPVKYRVIKLSSHGYPKADPNGKPITWISNFGIIDGRGHYVDGVKYTLILPALPANQVYVNYDKGQVIELVPVQTAQPTQVVLVELASGDPPIGIRT